ncbi:MAG: GtrA family protein [Cyanobacteria bacterium J06598_1]
MSDQNNLLNKLQKLPIGRFLRFGVVGFSGLFVDIVVFSLLRENTGLNWRLCTAISIEAAIINNFLWNDAWTFADLAQQQQGQKARFRRFLKFNSVCLLGAFLQYGLMELMLKLPAIASLPALVAQSTSLAADNKADEYFAKIIAIAIVTLWNFWINLKLSWRTPKS